MNRAQRRFRQGKGHGVTAYYAQHHFTFAFMNLTNDPSNQYLKPADDGGMSAKEWKKRQKAVEHVN